MILDTPVKRLAWVVFCGAVLHAGGRFMQDILLSLIHGSAQPTGSDVIAAYLLGAILTLVLTMSVFALALVVAYLIDWIATGS